MIQSEELQRPSGRQEGSITHSRLWQSGGVEWKTDKKAGTDEIRTREVSHHGLDRA